MTFADKIDEWIKEAETRPGSALMILKLIAGRMRDLAERNEELLAENIALQNGTRVEEYRKRITHLEYQLAMLKKRFGADGDLSPTPEALVELQVFNLLAYNSRGRILRFEVGAGTQSLGRITGEMSINGEMPRLLPVNQQDEVLLLFTSGRISTLAVDAIPLVEAGRTWNWNEAPLPDEPHAGELLACLTPLSSLPLSDFILQASRRGSVKKTLSNMSETVLSNHYLGRGALQKADQAFDACLARKKERYVLVSSEGRVLGLDTDELSYASEERIHLGATDYIVASFVLPAGKSLICLPQTGKVIERAADSIEVAKSPQARGQGLISAARLEQGTRFIGALACGADERVAVLDTAGRLEVHAASALSAAGALKTAGPFLSVAVIPGAEEKGETA